MKKPRIKINAHPVTPSDESLRMNLGGERRFVLL